MIGSFAHDRARWMCDLKDAVLVVIKKVDHITHADIVSAAITSCQASKRKAKKIKKGGTQNGLTSKKLRSLQKEFANELN